MSLANTYTKTPVSQAVSGIQQLLALKGAKAILTEYGHNGEPCSVSFRINQGEQQLGFRLPGDWERTLKALTQDKSVPRHLCNKQHAQRVVWACIRDWLRAQIAFIEIGAVSLDQIMLPYAVTPTGETLYEQFQRSSFTQLALPASK